MRDYRLSKERIVELEKLRRSLRDKRQADRVKAVIALSKGCSATQVAEILLFDEKTSRKYFERYQQGGSRALLDDNYSGAETKLDEHQISELESYLEEYIFTEAKSIIAHIYKQYKVRYLVGGITDLLHRLGFSYKKPKHVPGKHDPTKQQAFLEEYEQIKANKDANDPVYFADATYPQHNSIPSYGWIKRGHEKELKANCGRQRLNINGAINIGTLESTTGFYDTINAQATNGGSLRISFFSAYQGNLYIGLKKPFCLLGCHDRLLKQPPFAQATIDLFAKIETKHPNAETIYIIVDNARYYRSLLLKEYTDGTKIKLIFLPPYSPNLNLIERYWKFFKKKVLNNCYYETFEEFKRAGKSFSRKRKQYLPELQTLLTENFHIQAA